jgi:GT2 family glycosyltransferase
MIEATKAAMAHGLIELPGWRITARKPVSLADCSLIVASYQRPDEVAELLRSLSSMAELPGEVIVVDGSPGFETEKSAQDVVRELALPFDLIYVRSPKGLTRQRNVGVDLSSKAFLFFLDDDAIPQAGYFRELRRVLVQDRAGAIGAVGGCIINEIDKPISRRWQLRRTLGIIPKVEPYIYNHAGTTAPTGLQKPFRGVREVDMFPGGACVIRRSVLNQIRFSEFFQGYSYGEDLEMSLRIRRQWRIQYCGDARVWHYGIERKGGRPNEFAKGRMEVINRYFIWRRYSGHTSVLNQMRLNLDLLFIFFMDVAWWAAKPWRGGPHMRHGLGIAAGMAKCAVAPPLSADVDPVPRYRLVPTQVSEPAHDHRLNMALVNDRQN